MCVRGSVPFFWILVVLSKTSDASAEHPVVRFSKRLVQQAVGHPQLHVLGFRSRSWSRLEMFGVVQSIPVRTSPLESVEGEGTVEEDVYGNICDSRDN